ncbi:vesicle transport through interaction with t-SNAREs homolog 1A-like [Dysidea avara]|uniref:vesicle transport through interaction with t-SNAREs homolog 1A-like n=1 Tax=Dysidea avara TaxID=196820 RepID=UPI003325F334
MSMFESYEQQFSSITADITARIGKIPNLTGTDKKTEVGVVQGNLDEAKELVDQMEIEIHDMASEQQPAATKKLKSYRSQLDTLQKEFRKAQIAVGNGIVARRELLGAEETHYSDDQRAQLLDNTETVDRTSRRLDEGKRIARETEEIGLEVIGNLHGQRETLEKSRHRLRETNEDLSKGSRIIRRISKRVVQHRIIIIVAALIILAVMGLIIFGIVKAKQK